MISLSDLKYRQKILVLLAPVFILISTGLYIVYNSSYNSLLSGQRERLNRIAGLTSDRLKRKEEEMMKLVNLFQSNRPLIEYLYILTVLGEDRKPLINMLRPMYISLNVNSLILFDKKGRGVLELDTKPGHNMSDSDIHKLEGPLPREITSGFSETYGTAKITGLGPLLYMGRVVGYISVGTYVDGEYLSDLKNISGSEFFFVKGRKIITSTLGEKDFPYLPSEGKIRIGPNSYSVFEQEITGRYGKKLGSIVTALPDKELHESLGKLKLYIFGMLGVSAVVSFGLSILFIKALVEPLREMVFFIGRLAKGEFNENLKIKGSDEIAALSGHFNNMQRQLRDQRLKLEHYTDDLEKAVEERTSELEKIQRQLLQSQKMDSLGTLSSGIAHDFNNLLSAILGYASFIKEEIDATHPHYRYWDIIEQASLRGTELTGKLMTFSGGRVDLENKKTIDINQLIEELVKLLSRTFPKAISFETNLSDEDICVLGDGNSIYQALMNICINARDAMPDGGRLILETATIEAGELITASDSSSDYVRISITDTGMGIKKEVIDRIFEPFFTTKKQGSGTGLGLSIVYGIIQKHNGFINVYSEQQKGTTFTIYMPSCAKCDAEEKAEVSRLEASRPGMTILVVDDEEPLRMLCTDILEGSGYKVLTASNGLEAIEIFRNKPEAVSLVLLDMVMPGLSGHETYKRLKDIAPDVKVIITSGFSPSMGVNWAAEEGILGFIQKPYRAQDILKKINEVVR